MHRLRSALLLGSVFLAFAVPFSAAAETAYNVDISHLQSYEQQYLKASEGNKAYYQNLIDRETQNIRSQLQDQINTLVQPSSGNQVLEPGQAVQNERSIVADLESRLNESTVDLNILKNEEQVYTGQKSGSGVYMTTTSYPELLAKKVVLEQQIDLLTSALSAQQDRLQQLVSTQQSQSMQALYIVLWYLAIIFAVLWGEYLIRSYVLVRIPQRGLRYALSKIFTLLVYISLLFWVIQRIYTSYPGLGTVFAVIGAALVFMFQDVIKSLLGWFTYKGSIRLGQRVTLGGYTGDVLDIDMLFTTILVARAQNMDDPSQAGKVVRVPNLFLLTGALLNWSSTSDFESVEIPIRIEDGRQWEVAQRILEEILREETLQYVEEARRQMQRRMRGFYHSQVSPSQRVYMDLQNDGKLLFLLCFPAPIGQRRVVMTRILQHIIRRFDTEKIRLGEEKG
ncbi:MAG TPA: mechanosensitive ion channel family protein [Candidatus Peribacteraceae bacterium]|nr:mechanosensitive ion channel family protein [Candidatus Peribacteraceae bacterium]